MTDDLPFFRYHPDPLATGSIQQSDSVCECCGLARGFVNTCNFYSTSEEQIFCPWCISTGLAAKKFDGIFCDDYSLINAGLPTSIIEEVTQRTPGFNSWQSEAWLTCCGDACEFYGDAPVDEVKNLSDPQLVQMQKITALSIDRLRTMAANYIPASSPAFYKWKCRVCGNLKYFVDYS